jgi:hypothetical protein
MLARLPRWMWIGLLANAGLWALIFSVSSRVGSDLLGGPKQWSDGTSFQIAHRFDGPEHVLLGREVGGGTSLFWFILRTINAPTLLVATGRDVGGGMKELRAPLLVVGVTAQWIAAGILWLAWRRRTECRRAVEQRAEADGASRRRPAKN